MTATDHIEQIHANGWTRVDTAPDEWVALVPNDNNTAFGGTLWKRGSDGADHAEGVTEGYPVTAALTFESAARVVAVLIKGENA